MFAISFGWYPLLGLSTEPSLEIRIEAGPETIFLYLWKVGVLLYGVTALRGHRGPPSTAALLVTFAPVGLCSVEIIYTAFYPGVVDAIGE